MADNTRVNELQEKLLKAIDILNAQALNSISFDKTITCKIESDKDKKDGKYEVNDGNRIFTAYSTDTSFRAGDTVYVTVPEGKFENQKMIIGKKTADNDKPFNFVQPFDTFFDMTGNLAVDATAVEAVANYEEHKTINILDIDVSEQDIIKYTRLAIRANFRSWIKNAISGNYGIDVILTTDKPNTTTGDMKNGTYTYRFDSSMFYGNPYNFETYYSQELVLDLEKQDIGKVTGIRVDFYQDDPFKDKQGIELDSKEQDGNLLAPNLFVDNLEVYFGKDISTFTSDMVEIYTANGNSYNKETIANNTKQIKLRWVHLQDGAPIDAIKNPDKLKQSYEIRWYQYEIGCKAADSYSGIYWKNYITGTTEISFNPNTEWQREKIKVVILVGEGKMPYYSNELIFENEEEVPSYSTLAYTNALEIVTDDGTNGNYFLYGQDDRILERTESNKERTLSCLFSKTGANHNSLGTQDYLNTKWFIDKNSMFDIKNNTKEENGYYIIEGEKPQYSIKSSFRDNLNNTIRCEYTLENRVYVSEKEFSFGRFGTMGTDQTLVIDFEGDKKAININDESETETFIVRLYEGTNEITIPETTKIEWSWYYPLSNNILQLGTNGKSTINITKNNLTMDSLHILKVKVGDLETYFPIPLKATEEYSYISGPTQIIYKASGEPNYITEDYNLFGGSTVPLEGVTWKIYCPDIENTEDEKKKIELQNFIGTIKNNRFQPCKLFVRDASVYGVQAINNENKVLWTQPILVLQNKWASGVINAWDGESININKDEGYILSPAIAAGKKDVNNTFSGVMIGDWQDKNTEDSIARQTGIYGFHQGAMSYALTEDGKAFFGKDGQGRIYINGNDATLYSNNWETRGMKIDLNAPWIKLTNGTNYITIDATKTGAVTSADTSKAPFKIGSKFSVAWDGTIYATGGNFTGNIDATSGFLRDLTLTGDLSIADGGNIYVEAEKYTEDGPIYVDYNNKTLGSFGLVVGKDGDTSSTTYNIGITSSSNTSNGTNFPSIVLESQRHIRLSAQNNGTVFIDADHITFICDAANQFGIYARFA